VLHQRQVIHLYDVDDQIAHQCRSPSVVGVGSGPEQNAGASDGQRVAVHQGGCFHVMALHIGAVGRAQVGGDHAVGGDADLQMPAGDAGVVDDDVCLAAAADHGDGAGEQVALPVDVHDRVAG